MSIPSLWVLARTDHERASNPSGITRSILVGLLGSSGSLLPSGSTLKSWLAGPAWVYSAVLARCSRLGLLTWRGSLISHGSVSTAVARSVTLGLLLFLGSLCGDGAAWYTWLATAQWVEFRSLARSIAMGLLASLGSLHLAGSASDDRLAWSVWGCCCAMAR